MDIIINDTQIDVKLEDEKNVLQVIVSLERWLLQQHAFMVKTWVDDQLLNPSDAELLERLPIEEVRSVRILSEDIDSIADERIRTVIQYIYRMLTELKNDSDDLYEDSALDGFSWLRESVLLIVQLHIGILAPWKSFIGQLEKDSEALKDRLEKAKNADSEQRRAIFDGGLRQLLYRYGELSRTVLLELVRSKEQPVTDESLTRIEESYKAVAPHIDDVSELLQTGKEVEAMNTIQEVARMLDAFFYAIRSLEAGEKINLESICIDSLSLKEWVDGLLPVGREVIDSFANQDTVLLGDLFEYELRDKLALLPGYISSLREAMKSEPVS